MSDEHATQLAAWLLNTIGRALGIGFGAGLVISIVGGAFDPDWIPLGFIAGPLVLALVLVNAEAPPADTSTGAGE